MGLVPPVNPGPCRAHPVPLYPRAPLRYVNMANERRIAELTTRASSASASAHVEGGDLRRDAAEAGRLRGEVSRLTGLLEAKSNEVSTAMITFAEMQRMTAEREAELKAKLAAAEGKVDGSEVRAEEYRAELSASKQELTAAIADVNSLRDRLADLRRSGLGGGGGGGGASYSEVADLKAKLAVETSLKDRAEVREEAERRERVATNAQLVAVEQRWVRLMEEARVAFEGVQKKLINERDEYSDRASSLAISSKELKESCERLEAEKRTLQRGFERLKAASGAGAGFRTARKDSDSYSEEEDGYGAKEPEKVRASGDWASMNPIERELALMSRSAEAKEPDKVRLARRKEGRHFAVARVSPHLAPIPLLCRPTDPAGGPVGPHPWQGPRERRGERTPPQRGGAAAAPPPSVAGRGAGAAGRRLGLRLGGDAGEPGRVARGL